MPLFQPEYWKSLDAHGKVNQEEPAIVYFFELGNEFVYTANIDQWLEMWQYINKQIEDYQRLGAGTIFIRFRGNSELQVTPIPPTLADLRLEGETDDVQLS